MSLNFGQEFIPFGGFGLGGVVEGVANKLNQMFQTPSEKFFSRLYEAFENISSLDPSLPLDQQSRARIENLAESMNHMPYKNATTLVLGCLSTLQLKKEKSKNGDVSYFLNEKVLTTRIFPLLPSFRDSENITQFDVIRYARFALIKDFVMDDNMIESEEDTENERSERSERSGGSGRSSRSRSERSSY
ncbi:hypothetical protein IIV31_171R [Armadillidium vulgare iridescent virus]|uniref:Uncharacterized protein n=1 Tax=Armadillidium vulgare iridescent virus TaxID=72201 RepID=A0A068QL20_9VIRU|nr:hypothetical protein IIV31_171R [Armadillidium vulgare iridescent virus]CCV02543.1 hypothetical protein IIV31_171R [Armadillidium vulgare iridescent virus]